MLHQPRGDPNKVYRASFLETAQEISDDDGKSIESVMGRPARAPK